MNTLITLLSQRRVWAALVAVLLFSLPRLGIDVINAPEELTALFSTLGEALATLIITILSLHSYFKPKK